MIQETQRRETKMENIGKSINFKTLPWRCMTVIISSAETGKNLQVDIVFGATSTYRSRQNS
jgi:hypothetical protein